MEEDRFKRQPRPARRLFFAKASENTSEVFLRGPEKKYIRDVLRMSPGDSLILFDGKGWEFPATIIEATQRYVSLKILGKQPGRRESPVEIRLGVGLLKTNKMDLVIQKVAELGVKEIYPVAARRALTVLDEDRAEKRRGRWQKIAQEACRQCGRSTVAAVHRVLAFDELVAESKTSDLSLLFTTDTSSPLGVLAQQSPGRPRRMLLLVGPEGGFSPEEERKAENKGFIPVGLGPRVLRAETAAILAVGLVQYLFGDLSGNPGDVA